MEGISDFASLIQFGAGLNLGVSALYYWFEAERSRIDQKLKVLENSAITVAENLQEDFRSERRSIAHQVNIATKSLKAPNQIVAVILIGCGIICVALLILIGYDPKNLNPIWRQAGIFFTVVPVPFVSLIYYFVVREAFSECWRKLSDLERKFFQ